MCRVLLVVVAVCYVLSLDVRCWLVALFVAVVALLLCVVAAAACCCCVC